jgi:hypothetical protein
MDKCIGWSEGEQRRKRLVWGKKLLLFNQALPLLNLLTVPGLRRLLGKDEDAEFKRMSLPQRGFSMRWF